MKILQYLFVLTTAISLPLDLAANVECDAEATNLHQRAKQADDRGRLEEARELYTRAATQCDRPEYWMSVGDIWTNDFLTDSADGINQEGGPAVEAYANAFKAARRDSNKSKGAAAARAMAELGLMAGDPIKANEWLIVARELDPTAATLADLEAEMEYAQAELSPNEIDTGFSQTRGLGKVAGILMSGTSGAYWSAEAMEQAAATEREQAAAVKSDSMEPAQTTAPDQRINLPINFEFNSTMVTVQTERNIENLAKVLAGKDANSIIMIIGHSDVRGSADANMHLSQERAQVVRRQLLALQPSLSGRVVAQGRGETQPANSGMSERAHAANRRLEVIIRD